eukprot:760969-Hanusia_phi.AAC.2
MPRSLRTWEGDGVEEEKWTERKSWGGKKRGERQMPAPDSRPVVNSNKRILIVADGKLLANDSGLHKFFRSSHTLGKEQALYLHIDGKVLEVKRAKRNKYSCWFLGDSCAAEGDFFLATRVDPLFLALPFLNKVNFVGWKTTLLTLLLAKARNKTAEHAGRFCSKDQIFVDDPQDESASILNSVTSQEDIAVLCDVQLVGDDQFFRLNDDKVLDWMRAKVFAVIEHVYPGFHCRDWRSEAKMEADPSKEESMSEKIKLMVGESCADAERDSHLTLQEQADRVRSERERMIFGILLVGDYLPEQWAQSLKASFGITDDQLAKTKEMSSPGEERFRTHTSGPSKREAEQGHSMQKDCPLNLFAASGSQKKAKSTAKADKIPTKGMQVCGDRVRMNPCERRHQQAMTAFFKPTAKA